MTARERVLGTINGTPVDRVPIFDLIQHKELCEHVTGQPVTIDNGMELLLATIRDRLDITRGIAPPSEERTWKDDEGFVYKGEWWTTWIVERPFKDTEGCLEYIRGLIDRLPEIPEDSLYTFFGQGDVWAKDAGDPNEEYRKLQERLENVVLIPSESPVGLDSAFHRLGMELFVYAYADDPELVSQLLEALNQHEIQRVHHCANADLAPGDAVWTMPERGPGPGQHRS